MFLIKSGLRLVGLNCQTLFFQKKFYACIGQLPWACVGISLVDAYQRSILKSKKPFNLAVTLLWNGACAHYVMVSKIQWKPFWLATQLYPRNNWTGWQKGVNNDVFAQACNEEWLLIEIFFQCTLMTSGMFWWIHLYCFATLCVMISAGGGEESELCQAWLLAQLGGQSSGEMGGREDIRGGRSRSEWHYVVYEKLRVVEEGLPA